MNMTDKLKKQLTSSRMTLKHMTALVLFGAIILVFILFGFQGRHTAMGTGAVARVNSALISVADLSSESQRLEQIYGQMFAGQMSGDAQRQFLRGQALDNLITNELISQAATKQGILVTDAEVRDYVLTEMPVFQRDGRFQHDLYVQILEANHLSPSDFENKVRKDRDNMRTRRLFEVAASPLDLEIQKLKTLRENKMDVQFAKIDEDHLSDVLPVSEKEIQANLAKPDFMKKVEADFSMNKQSYSSEEQVHASHILIKTKPNDPVSEKNALAKIESIKKEAKTMDFGKLAAKYSEDAGSKKNKGDLGFFGRGKMLPEFEKAAFSQPMGEVGGPIKTVYGYHLIKVLGKKTATQATLENTKTKIAKKLLAQEKIDATTKMLEEALRSGKVSEVDSLLKSLGVPWEETGYFDLDADYAPKLSSRVASEAAFEVSASKPLLPRLVRDGVMKFVLKFKGAKKESDTADKSKPAQDWIAQVNRERSYEMFAQWIEQEKKSATIEKNQSAVRGE